MAYEEIMKDCNPLGHYSIEGAQSVYDEEAMTSLELAGRSAKKVNELIGLYNAVREYVTLNIFKFDHKLTVFGRDDIPATVKNQIQALIDSGVFDQAIGAYADDLQARLDRLLGSVPEGSTTMDAEIIDGRLGADGKTYNNLGEAIRQQFGKTLRVVNHTFTDANQMDVAGIYFKGAEILENLPEALQDNAGFIITFDGAQPQRKLQMFVGWYGNIATRRKQTATEWSEWITLAKESDSVGRNNELTRRIDDLKALRYIKTDSAVEWDADKIMDTGLYFLGSSHVKKNVPTDNGLLIVFKGGADYNRYQMWIDYDGDGVYYRNYVYNGQSYRGWRNLNQTDSSPYFVRGDGTTKGVYIYRRTVNGYIRYWYGNHASTSLKLNTYRLKTIDVCDKGMNVIMPISSVGHDQEGVIKLLGAQEHLGGVHGYEESYVNRIFVNGKEYNFANVPTTGMNADVVRIYVEANLGNNVNDNMDVTFRRYKNVVFDNDGVHIRNRWENVARLSIERLSGAMFSIDKGAFDDMFLPIDFRTFDCSEFDNETVHEDDADHVTEAHFNGVVSAISRFTDVSGDGCRFTCLDYGDRWKVYYDNHFGVNEDYYDTVNHIDILY